MQKGSPFCWGCPPQQRPTKNTKFDLLNLPFYIARHYLQQQKGAFAFITRLSVIATALSVAVMLLALAVVTGFEETVKEKLYSFSGHVHVLRFDATQTGTRTAPPVPADTRLLRAVQQLPGVQQAFYFAQRPVIIQAHGLLEGLQLKGVGPAYRLPASIGLNGHMMQYPDSGYSRDVVLSDATANALSLKPGDTVLLQYFSNEGMPRMRKVLVTGTFHTGMAEIDKNYALCDLRLLQRLNNWTADSINALQVDLTNDQLADPTAAKIHYDLIQPPLQAFTTEENYPAIFDWLKLQKINSAVLLLIMGIVAIINMGAVLVILMVDRAAMIGLLKALGMTYRDTVRIFLAIGTLLGGAGIVLGNVFTFLFAWLQLNFHLVQLPEDTYYMKYAPVKLVWWHVVATDAGCLALLILCMWLPALYLRTIQPARALNFR
ncbi:MAG: ABC transporter permease [Chitinophagia bacterium]|nr:ABC transporter permease [Chitinophagia bacterium]